MANASGPEKTGPAFLAEPLEAEVRTFLESHADRLTQLSQEIWRTPELCYEEFTAVKLITEYLEREGYRVTRNYCDIATSFLAEFQTVNFNPTSHPTIAILCEYDALPEIGHACGHNLISEAGLAAFLGVCSAAAKNPSSTGIQLEGRILCMGTPAEEGGGGKVRLVAAGAFKDVDFAMMVHPAPVDLLEPSILGNARFTVEYFGRAAHASCGPWEGVNALDAAVAAYNNVSLLRQSLKPGHQVHIVLLNGGAKPNIIPDYTKSQYMIRAPTSLDMQNLKNRVMDCVNAAAAATGCRIETQFAGPTYEALMSNKAMIATYKYYGLKQGMFFPVLRPSYGSTDMGNVSLVTPSIHPAFSVGELHMIHTKEFQVAAGKPRSDKLACRAGLVMCMTTLELLSNPSLRADAKAEFERTKETFVGSVMPDSTEGFSSDFAGSSTYLH